VKRGCKDKQKCRGTLRAPGQSKKVKETAVLVQTTMGFQISIEPQAQLAVQGPTSPPSAGTRP